MASAARFSGVGWLSFFPYYFWLRPEEAKVIKLNVAADGLSEGEENAFILVLGARRQEAVIVPVDLKIKPAPKLKLEKLLIDDGVAPGTKGNADHVANPQETIQVSLLLRNVGHAPAKKLRLEFIALNPAVEFISYPTLDSGDLRTEEGLEAKFLLKISPEANGQYPPLVKLKAADSSNRQWNFKFYLGEPGKFIYPTI